MGQNLGYFPATQTKEIRKETQKLMSRSTFSFVVLVVNVVEALGRRTLLLSR